MNHYQPDETWSNPGIRELSPEELDAVHGGVLPVIGFGLSLASHVGVGGAATSAVGHVMSGVGLGLATYGLARYLGGGRHRNRKVTSR